MIAPALLGVFQLLQDQHAGAFAEDEAVAVEVERPGRLLRLLVVRGKGGQQVEAGHAEGVDHAVGAAGQHQVGVAVANHLGRLADRLAAGGAGRQAVVIGAEQTEIGGEVAGRGVQFLFGLRSGLELAQSVAGESRGIDAPLLDDVGPGDQRHQSVEILDAFAGAEVDAEAVAVHAGVVGVEQAGVFQRLLGGGGGELAVDAGMLPATRVGDEAAEVEVLDLGGELRRKALGVESVDRPDAAAALQLGR